MWTKNSIFQSLDQHDILFSRCCLVHPETVVSGVDLCRCLFFIYLFQRRIFKVHRPIGMKFCTIISSSLNFIMPVQNFGGTFPKIFLGVKSMPNFVWFWATSKFDGDYLHILTTVCARWFNTSWDIQNQTSAWSTAIPPAFGEKSTVNFGPLTTKILMCNYTHPSWFFRETIFWPPKFLHVLENGQVLLAHPPPG